MGLAYNRDRHPGQKVNPRQQGKRTKPLVLRVTVYAAGFGYRTKIGTRSGDRLYAGFFITGDGMDHRLVFRDYDAAVFIELQRYLLVNKKHIVHFLFKIRIALFTVIFDLEWFQLVP